MLRSEVLRDFAAVARFVEARVFEADGERVDGTGRVALHERGDEARVDAAGEEDAEGNVGDHAQRDGVAEELVERIDRVVLGAREAIRGRAFRDFGRVPVARAASKCRRARR